MNLALTTRQRQSKMSLVTFLLLGSLLLATASGGCPGRWFHLGLSCYHFSHDTESWTGAQGVCRIYTAHLAEIKTDAENAFLTKELAMRNSSFWIGAADLLYEGEWVWMNSRTAIANATYTNWKPGSPDNVGKNENCAMIDAQGLWTDGQCAQQSQYICQRSVDHVGDVFG